MVFGCAAVCAVRLGLTVTLLNKLRGYASGKAEPYRTECGKAAKATVS